MFRCYTKFTKSDAEQRVKKPRVCVVGKHSEGVLEIAVSRCSSKDHFVKSKGRAIAEGRLLKGKLYKKIELKECKIGDFIKIANEIIKDVEESFIVFDNSPVVKLKKVEDKNET